MRILVDQEGHEAVIGAVYWDFRHENQYRLDRIDAPTKPSSTGRVQCTRVYPINKENAGDEGREFFPGVLNLEWRDQ